MQTKAHFKLRDVKLTASETNTMEFSGYGAVFDNVDSYGDMIKKGAFAKFIDDVKSGTQQYPSMLLQHGGWGINSTDMMPVGIWTDIQEDDIGLKLTGKLAETQNGKEAYQLLKMTPRPAITGLSIGYYTRDSSYGGKQDAYDRLLKQIDVLEISLVTFPANDKARVTGVKSTNDITERDFEQLLHEAGFDKKAAQIIIEQGYQHFVRQTSDINENELKSITEQLQKNIALLQ